MQEDGEADLIALPIKAKPKKQTAPEVELS